MRRMHDEQEIANKLYLHIVYMSDDETNLEVLFTIISPKSFVIDSLTDLKTYLGNTFSYQIAGYDWQGGCTLYQMNETDIIGTDGNQNWSRFTIWNDTVKAL